MAAFSQTTTQPISSFPYVEDFENGPGGWISGSLSTSAIPNKFVSWQYSNSISNVLLHKPKINYAASGTGYWVTCDTVYNQNRLSQFTKYVEGEHSYVKSPAFDLSSLSNPIVEAKIWWEIERMYD